MTFSEVQTPFNKRSVENDTVNTTIIANSVDDPYVWKAIIMNT